MAPPRTPTVFSSFALAFAFGCLAAGCGSGGSAPEIRDEALRVYDDLNQIVREKKSASEYVTPADLDGDGDADVVLKIQCGCSPACRLAYDVVFLNEGGKYRECGHITRNCDGRAGRVEYGARDAVFARFSGEECYESAKTTVEDGVETLTEEYTYYRVTEEYVFAGDRVVLKRRRRFQISMNELEFLPKP